MAIKKDVSDVPAGDQKGNPPDAESRYGQALAQAWWAIAQERDADHQRSRTDVDRYIRLGWGGKCARELGYRLLDVPQSDPPDVAALWRMGLGTIVHEQLQDALVKVFPDASIEHVVGAAHDETFGFPVSGRTDVFLVEKTTVANPDEAATEETWRTVIEVKTINGFGFKMAVGARGAAEGPRSGAIFQAALNGRALDADEVVIVYLSLECLSDRELTSLVGSTGGTADPERKFVAEWTYAMADLDDMVDREIKRLTKVMDMVDARAHAKAKILDGTSDIVAPLPPRSIPLEMPAGARVTDPATGSWTLERDGNVLQAGKTWWCQYCSYQRKCQDDGPS